MIDDMQKKQVTEKSIKAKVGLLTWFQYHNYGTALQAVALYKSIKKFGYDVYAINYKSTQNEDSIPDGSFFNYLGSKTSQILKGHFYRVFTGKERTEKFNKFLNDNLVFTKSVETMSELEDLNDFLDAFVCGSDQIWAPSSFNPHYFLDFVHDRRRKIAYAPSVGLKEIKDPYKREQIKKLTSDFSFLSVREKAGADLISELTKRSISTVLDPSLLLSSNEWDTLCENSRRIVEGNYLLVYLLGTNEKYWNQIYNFANEKNLPVRIVPVYDKDLKRNGCISESVGPAEFISLIKHASYVCTDSFHGTAFSVIYKRNFFTFKRFKDDEKLNQNSRLENLFSILHLESRFISDIKEAREELLSIDYNVVYSYLNKAREASLEYLENALSSIPSREKNKNHVQHEHTLCCGCAACASVCPVEAINIRIDEEGFYHAFVDDDKCVSCGKCKKVCPFIARPKFEKVNEYDCFAYKSNSAQVLGSSSSGGAAHDLSEIMLKKGFAVAGCTYNRKEEKAEHIIITSPDDLLRLTGSKYIQSDFRNIPQKLHNKMMVFGTPCQIAAIRSLIKEEDDVFLVDLICHGVPSYFMFKSYLEWLEREKHITKSPEIIFRYKKSGWRDRYIYTANSRYEYTENQHKDPFYRVFRPGYCYQKSCFDCEWRDTSAADIRIGDYWDLQFAKDKTGVSMVIPFTRKGNETVKELEEKGKLLKKNSIDYYKCQQTNNNLPPAFREAIINGFKEGQTIESIIKKYIQPQEIRTSLSKNREKVYDIYRRIKHR